MAVFPVEGDPARRRPRAWVPGIREGGSPARPPTGVHRPVSIAPAWAVLMRCRLIDAQPDNRCMAVGVTDPRATSTDLTTAFLYQVHPSYSHGRRMSVSVVAENRQIYR